ncbi:hypothetical protein ACFQ1S_16410 [Kibdelosporangium lantanae]|uniref:Uncharacterized protein n=1 Tax=Kibdelosporangium lantanae TaxID=1497396 RepID=A0ABW3M8T8_9PSEU
MNPTLEDCPWAHANCPTIKHENLQRVLLPWASCACVVVAAGAVVADLDGFASVRGVDHATVAEFARTGSAYGVVKAFADTGRLFPQADRATDEITADRKGPGRTPTTAVEIISRYGAVKTSAQLAEQVDIAGLTTGKERPFDTAAVARIRDTYGIPAPRTAAVQDGEVLPELANGGIGVDIQGVSALTDLKPVTICGRLRRCEKLSDVQDWQDAERG